MDDDINKKNEAIWGALNQSQYEAGESHGRFEPGDLENATPETLQAATLIQLATIAGTLSRIEKLLEPLAGKLKA